MKKKKLPVKKKLTAKRKSTIASSSEKNEALKNPKLMLTKNLEAVILNVYNEAWEAYLKGDLKTHGFHLSNNFKIIGSSEAEQFNSKQSWLAYCKKTIKQFAGVVRLKNRDIQLVPAGEGVMVVENSDIYVLIDKKWSFYSRIRITALLQKEKTGWKYIHQHGSLPDARASEGEVIATAKIKKENLQLKEAVKRRTVELVQKNRELAIEAAMEKVRVRSLAMQKPEELKDVAEVLRNEMGALGVEELETSSIYIVDDTKGTTECWYAIKDIRAKGKKLVTDHMTLRLHETWVGKQMQKFYRSKQTHASVLMKGENRKEWINYCAGKSSVLQGYYGGEIPERTYHLLKFSNGFMGAASPGAISNESWDLLQRATSVFSFAYKRFNDLQKAEAQAREAQIEAALERVRAQTMAMHNSEDIGKCIVNMFGELTALGVDEGTRFGIGILNHDNENNQLWTAKKDGEEIKMHIGNLDMTWHPLLISARKAWKAQIPFHYYVLEGEDLLQYYQMLNTAPDYKIQIPLENLPEKVIQYCFIFEHGFFYAFTPHEFQPDLLHIIQRFSLLFAQTYRRYLDLVMAEAQAREAQIEAALERVRSRSLAMHKSEELEEVILVVSEQLQQLQFKFHNVSFGFDTEQMGLNFWLASPGLPKPFLIKAPYIDNPAFNRPIQARNNGIDFNADILSREENIEFLQHMFDNSEWSHIPDENKSFLLGTQGYARSQCLMKNTILTVGNYALKPYSEEQNAILRRFGNVFEQAYVRFLDLQKAEAQAREALIEAGLERVRSRSMAMHISDELADLSLELVKQVQTLGVATWFCAFNIYDEDGNDSLEWGSNGKGTFPEYKTPREGIFLRYYEAGQNGETLLVNEIGENECPAHYEYLCSLPGVGDQLLKMKASNIPFPASQIDHVAYFKYGYLLFITYEPTPESHDIFKRFAKVFEQTYTRFLDLQKAEAQAREAKVEAALERVRAQAMAMHHSEDLGKTIQVYFEQLYDLIDSAIVRCGAGLLNKENTIADMSTASKSPEGEPYNVKGTIDMRGHPLLESTYEHWLQQKEHSYVLRGNEIKEYYQYITNQVAIPENKGGDEHHFYFPMFTEGSFYVVTNTEVPENELQIFRRFSSVLSLTYRRFNDLQKAEAQAREAQIETALERVRSRTMGMQNSEELPEVANILFTEVRALGIHAWSCGYNILAEDKRTATCWMSSEGTLQAPFQLRLWGEASFDEMGDFIRSEKTMLVQELRDNAIEEHYAYMKSFPDLKPTFDQIDALGLSLPTYQINHLCKFNQGFLLLITYEKVPEAYDIFKRFTKVFEQTYTRFLDLKRAEAQATEATRQASLDRVRGEIASMRTTDDLERITPLIWRELITLGVPFFRCGVFIINEHDQRIHAYLSTPEGKSLAVLHLPFDSNDTNRNAVEHWREQKVYTDHWDQQQFQAWAKAMMEQHQIEGEQQYQAGETPPESLSLQFIPFKQGMLYVGSSEPLAEDQINLVKSLADAFSVAYARYEDFKQLEDAKNRVEATLTELKATQSQLVQSEKMASLGELTAGIAHEIQNPLNFVNNFSEVSAELVKEMIEEVDKGNAGEVKAIANDVVQNLEKINHHGKRAADIVKGMLQHSRSSSGVKELTDINALADEYLRLAYHGLRAKDKSFNATMKTVFDESINNVNMIPQDIGRVILNLITNAFYTVSEKQKAESLKLKVDGEKYEPTVTVSTKKVGDKVLISVKDNGNGIPQKILDKIFQPFFTTKPTGQGTGLGLSLSYDIVKAHGGELKVETNEGESSIFIIQIPII